MHPTFSVLPQYVILQIYTHTRAYLKRYAIPYAAVGLPHCYSRLYDLFDYNFTEWVLLSKKHTPHATRYHARRGPSVNQRVSSKKFLWNHDEWFSLFRDNK